MRFSVIIPTHNRPDYLRAAVGSVLRQRDAAFKIIVINDGDMPAGPFDDPRVQVLDNQRAGAIAARNRGITEATGEAIALLDDDDQWTDEQFLSRASAAIEAGADLVHGDGRLVYEDGTPPKRFAFPATAQSLERDNTILISAVCYRRTLHEQLGGFDPALPFYADWDWYLRVARAGHRLHHLQHNVVDVRVHAGNSSGDTNLSKRQENLDVFAKKHGLPRLILKSHASFV